jgi:hypothetical protein
MPSELKSMTGVAVGRWPGAAVLGELVAATPTAVNATVSPATQRRAGWRIVIYFLPWILWPSGRRGNGTSCGAARKVDPQQGRPQRESSRTGQSPAKQET